MKPLSFALALALLTPSAMLPGTLAGTAAHAQVNQSFAFYFPAEHPLNQVLVDALRDGPSNASYHTFSGQGVQDVDGMLAAVSSFYLEHVNEPATEKSGLILQFEDLNLRWSEVRQMATASNVLVPEWTWATTELNKFILSDVDGVPTWVLQAENTLSLTLTPYRFNANQFEAGSPIYRKWVLKRKIPIHDPKQLEQVVKQATGQAVSISNKNNHEAILRVVREFPAFKGLLAQDPGQYFSKAANDAITPARASRLLRSLQVQSNTNINTNQNNNTTTRPQQNQRPPRKPGDRIGLGIALKGGSMPLWINSPSQQFGAFDPLNLFVPAAGLQIKYDIGPWLNTSDLFLTLGGGTNIQMISQSPLDSGTPSQIPGIPIQNPFATTMAILGEFGVLQRWQFGDYYVDGGLRGGVIYGLLFDSGVINQFTGIPDTPYTLTFGGTATVGAGWNITDNFSVGLDTGFRYYIDGFWTDSSGATPVAYPFLSAWGPVLELSVEYMF